MIQVHPFSHTRFVLHNKRRCFTYLFLISSFLPRSSSAPLGGDDDDPISYFSAKEWIGDTVTAIEYLHLRE